MVNPDGQIDLRRILEAIPRLQRPLVLLEGGAGGGGMVRLSWGNRTRWTLPWDEGCVGAIEWLARVPSEPRCYGFIAYDLGLPPAAPRRRPGVAQPLAEFFEPRFEVTFDTGSGLAEGSEDSLAALEQACEPSHAPEAAAPARGAREIASSFTREEFERAVVAVRRHIFDGNVYQANISVAKVFEVAVTPWDAYLRSRVINPSPWMGFADFGDWQVVSGSPELLVQVETGVTGRTVRTRPIAGTRKKTGNREKDAAMKAELRLDEKERAEHLMLVDLARNDIGRLVEYGSLEVAETAVVEEYSHVFHLVSEVRGKLRGTADHTEVLSAMFPCGTITGVPKIRAMEVIAELEPVARGGYTGAIGWMGGGEMQFNILIRSAIFRDGLASVQAGAGIVWDSVPEREWFESLRKAEAMRLALGASA